MNVHFAVCTAVRSSSESLPPPSRVLSTALCSLAFVNSLFAFFLLFFFFYYTSLVLMILKWRTSIRTLLFLSFASPFTPSLALSLSLSNTGRVLSDKNSSLNKHTIQKLLSYRLTASVKRVFILTLLFFFSLSPSPPTLLPISLSTWRS